MQLETWQAGMARASYGRQYRDTRPLMVRPRIAESQLHLPPRAGLVYYVHGFMISSRPLELHEPGSFHLIVLFQHIFKIILAAQ